MEFHSESVSPGQVRKRAKELKLSSDEMRLIEDHRTMDLMSTLDPKLSPKVKDMKKKVPMNKLN